MEHSSRFDANFSKTVETNVTVTMIKCFEVTHARLLTLISQFELLPLPNVPIENEMDFFRVTVFCQLGTIDASTPVFCTLTVAR